MGIMTTRRLRIALLGMSLTMAVVYVPACEYDTNSGQQPGQPAPAPSYTRAVDAPSGLATEIPAPSRAV